MLMKTKLRDMLNNSDVIHLAKEESSRWIWTDKHYAILSNSPILEENCERPKNAFGAEDKGVWYEPLSETKYPIQ